MFPFFICITTVILDFHNPLNYTASFSEKTTTHPLILSLICNPINYTCNPIIINTKQTLQTYVKTYKILLHNISMVLSIYWTHLCHNLKIIVIHSILLYYLKIIILNCFLSSQRLNSLCSCLNYYFKSVFKQRYQKD